MFVKLTDGCTVKTSVRYWLNPLPETLRLNLIQSARYQNRSIPRSGRNVTITIERDATCRIETVYRVPLMKNQSWKSAKYAAMKQLWPLLREVYGRSDRRLLAIAIAPECHQSASTKRRIKIQSAMDIINSAVGHVGNVFHAKGIYTQLQRITNTADKAVRELETAPPAKG